MKNVWPDVVAAYVGAGANPSDPEVARNPQLYLLYGQLQKYQADMAKGIMSRDTKKELAYLKERTAQLKSVADVSRTLAAASASASASSVTARAGIYKSAQRTSKELAEFMTQADDDQLMEIRQAAGRGGQVTPKDLITQAFSVQYRTVDPALPESKNALGTYNEILVQAGVAEGLQNPNPVAALRAAGVEVPEAMAVNIGAVKEKFDNAGSLLETAQSIVAMEKSGEAILGKFSAGVPLKDRQDAKKAQKALADAALEMETKAKGFYGDPESAYKELQRFYEEGVNEYARYGEVLNSLATGIIGDKKDLTPRGELVQSPQFQRWAKSNGVNVENLGYISKSGRYIEGPDDTKAIALYQYQMRNPNKLSPFVSRGKSSGEIQVIEKAMSPEELARFEQVGNKFLVRKDADGEHYLDKNDTLVKAASTGAIVLGDAPGGDKIVLAPPAEYLEYAKLRSQIEKAQESTQATGEEALTGEQKALVRAKMQELMVQVQEADPDDTFKNIYSVFSEGESADEKDIDAAQAALSGGAFQVVQVDANGVFSDVPAAIAQDRLKKFELSGKTKLSQGDEFLTAVAPGVEFTDKPPVSEVVVEVPVEHARDTREGVTTLKVDTAAGPLELALDDKDKEGGWRVASTEQLEGDWSKSSMRRRMTPDEKLADVRKDEAKEEAAAERKAERAQARIDRAAPATEPATAKDPVLQRFSKYLKGSKFESPAEPKDFGETTASIDKAQRSTVLDLYGHEGPIVLGGGVVPVKEPEVTPGRAIQQRALEVAKDPLYDSTLTAVGTAPASDLRLNYDYSYEEDSPLKDSIEPGSYLRMDPVPDSLKFPEAQLELGRYRDLEERRATRQAAQGPVTGPLGPRGKVSKRRGRKGKLFDLQQDADLGVYRDPTSDRPETNRN